MLASSTDFSNFLFSASVDRKLRKTRTVTDHIILVLILNVSVHTLSAHWFLDNVFLVWLRFTTMFASLLISVLLPKTALQLAANFIFGTRKFLFRGSSVVSSTFLTAADLITRFETGVKMLAIGIALTKFGISLLLKLMMLLRNFLSHTTFLHLAFITVFIFIKTLIKLIFILSLHKSYPIFIDKRFDLTCSFCIVGNSPLPSWSFKILYCFSLFLFYFSHLFPVYLLLVNMFLVVLRATLNFDLFFDKRGRRELKSLSNSSIIQVVSRKKCFLFGKWIKRHSITTNILFLCDSSRRDIFLWFNNLASFFLSTNFSRSFVTMIMFVNQWLSLKDCLRTSTTNLMTTMTLTAIVLDNFIQLIQLISQLNNLLLKIICLFIPTFLATIWSIDLYSQSDQVSNSLMMLLFRNSGQAISEFGDLTDYFLHFII